MSRERQRPAPEPPLEEADPLVCFCNEVRLSVIVRALDEGAATMAELCDATWAGCGPCGGSCQPDMAALLEDWLLAEEGAP